MEARILDGDKLRVTQDPKEIHAALDAKNPMWIELEQKAHACDVLLSQQLNLHPLTIEDIWATRSQPKLEQYDDGAVHFSPHSRAVTVAIGSYLMDQ